MNFLMIILAAAGSGLSVMLLGAGFERKNIWVGAIGTCLLITSLISIVVIDSKQTKEMEEARIAQQLKDEELKVPVLFSEADGCKVYKYKDGGWHRFVRCSPKDVVIINTK